MGFMSSALFWGLVFVFFGLTIMLKAFHIYIPFFRIFIAVFFLYIGLSILLGGFGWQRHKNVLLFSSGGIEASELKSDYSIVFSRGIVDLRKIKLPEQSKQIELNVVFGSCDLILPVDVPIEIKVTSVFSGTHMPDGNVMAFGEYKYQSDAYKEKGEGIQLEINVVFGGLDIRN